MGNENAKVYFPDAAQVLNEVVLLQMAIRVAVEVAVAVTLTVDVANANMRRPLRKLSGVLKPG